METPKFYNSLTRQVEPLNLKDPGKVRMYHCGPTVYKRQHIGNMRRYLFADFLRRALELLGYEVREITNITDVGHLTQDELDAGEDKLEVEAKRQKKTPKEIADAQIKLFEQDLQLLNIQPSHKYPRASEHIQQMQNIIGKLIEKGLAYETESGVYFDVTKFSNYGELSGNTLDKVEAGARVEVREEKRHPADFSLWKTDDPEHVQQWDSPWGRGYPGWHIECSAMSMEYLGTDIDIHTGGEDNKFPHHENEIAQSEGALRQTKGKKPRFVRHWMHNAHLRMAGQKLAKREGEQVTLDTIVEKGYSPLVFRLLVFSSHYRSPMDFSWEAMDQAQENLQTLKSLLMRLQEAEKATSPSIEILPFSETPVANFVKALADDLNTPAALAVVLEYARDINRKLDEEPSRKTASIAHSTLMEFDKVLAILEPLEREIESAMVPTDVQALVDARERARADGNFARSDELRDEIATKGYLVQDTSSGPRVVKE